MVLNRVCFVGFYMAPTLLRSYGDFPTFIGGGRPRVPLCAAPLCIISGTRIEPLMFWKLAI